MKYIINSIVPNKDTYLLDEVSCFEKAFAICLSKFDTKYPGLFYMFSSLIKCYHLDASLINEESDGFIFERYFGINFRKINVKDNLHQRIESYVKKEIPVVVPGNLRELYYSSHYKSSDSSHPFIIKGFDNERRIYYILDDSHLHGEKLLDFFLRYDDLEILNRSYTEKINYAYLNRLSLKEKEGFFIFDETNNKAESIDIFNSCIELYLNNSQTNKYKEKELIDDLANYLSNVEYDNKIKGVKIREIINSSKHKNVFFTELIENAYVENLISERSKEELNLYKNNLIAAWQKYSYYVAKLASSQSLSHEISIDKNIIDLEEELASEIKKAINKKARNKQESDKKPIKINKYILENQDDLVFSNIEDLITWNRGNGFTFRFSGRKLFDTWDEDESPKVFIQNSEELLNSKNGITIELSVDENKYSANFLSGIVIKTVKNEIYFFGIDSERRLNFGIDSEMKLNIDKAREYFSLAEKIGEFKKVCLRISMNENECFFSYKPEGSHSFQTLYSMTLENQDLFVGFGCKTFANPSPFVVSFNILSSC